MTRERVVLVVLYDGVRLLDVTGPLEVFAVATAPDVLLLPGSADVEAAATTPALLDQVRRLAAGAEQVASVCAGAFVLAAAGLLDGHRAATHWALASDLARRYPAIQVDADSIFVRDGRIITSAGISSGIDLALALVEEDHGPALARQVAKYLVVFMQRPGGQSQYSVRLRARARPADDPLRRVLDAIAADPAADHSVGEMAARARLSPRHLGRLFHVETGLSPAEYVGLARVEAARSLLERGDEGLDVVARRSGFGSPETLRRAFSRTLGVTPAAYRARFRTTGIGS
ncbi:helix-turn-helix domain-containing protein [Streptosporangiaceae bacterium NEAU-GS5]|nr:helix-turn-helix domain-containing protein [Streptosporangiaceae bacterium NEAU-GS5]